MDNLCLSKLDKKNTVELNEIIDSIKENYIKEIDFESKRQGNKLIWYSTPFASKNTYRCKVLEQIGLVLLAQRKVKTEKLSKIVVRTRLEKKILFGVVGKDIKIEVESQGFLFNVQILRDIAYILKYFAFIIAHYSTYFFVNMGKRVRTVKTNTFDVAETVLYSNSFNNQAELRDRHLGAVLDDPNGKNYIIFPVIYGLFNFHKFYKLVMESKKNFIFIQDLVGIFEALRVVFEVRRCENDPVLRFEIEGLDFSDFVSESLRKYKYKPSALYGHARYKAIRAIEAKNNWIIKSVLRWHENHEVDHMSVLAWHSLNNKPLVTGYADAFPDRNFLAPYVTEEELRCGSYPDRQLFIGAYWSREFGSFVENAPHFLANSSRFGVVWNLTAHKGKRETECRTILIALPVYHAEKARILDILSELDGLSREGNDNYIIRPHPADNSKISKKFNKLKIIIDRKSKFDNLLEQSDIVVGSMCSVQLQALLSGRSVITVSNLSRMSSCSVPKMLYASGYHEIYDVNQLVSILAAWEKKNLAWIDDSTRSMFVGHNLNTLSEFLNK
jgi:hypothetical protein